MRQLVVAATLALAALVWVASVGAESAPAPAASAAAPADPLTVAAGERLLLELETSLHTRHTQQGEHVYFITVDEVLVGYRVAIPRGSSVRATVTKVKRPGRLKGRAEIRLRFEEVILPDGTTRKIEAIVQSAEGERTDPSNEEGKLTASGDQGKETAAGASGGAIAGGTIGAISDRSFKGMGVGAAIGSGVGALLGLFKKGDDVVLEKGTTLVIQLRDDIRFVKPRPPARGTPL